MSDEMPDFDPEDTESIMKWAKTKGLESAKTIGILAGEAWNALEDGNYDRASVIYSSISTSTNHLAVQTFAMAQQEIMDEVGKTT